MRLGQNQRPPRLTLTPHVLCILEFYLLFYLWLRWSSLLRDLHCGNNALLCRGVGFSLRWPLLSRAQAPELRFGRCGERAQLLRCMWNPPGPSIKPVSPASAGGFLSIAPPGESGTRLYSVYQTLSQCSMCRVRNLQLHILSSSLICSIVAMNYSRIML